MPKKTIKLTADGKEITQYMRVWFTPKNFKQNDKETKKSFKVDLNVNNYKGKIHCRPCSKYDHIIDVSPSELFSTKKAMLMHRLKVVVENITKAKENNVKTFRATVNIVFSECSQEYKMYELNTTAHRCTFCKDTYEEVVGKEVVGEVTFILRKIQGRAKDYVFPLRYKKISDRLEFHDGETWEYAKYIELLGWVIDAEKFRKWAGRSMLSLEMEY